MVFVTNIPTLFRPWVYDGLANRTARSVYGRDKVQGRVRPSQAGYSLNWYITLRQAPVCRPLQTQPASLSHPTTPLPPTPSTTPSFLSHPLHFC